MEREMEAELRFHLETRAEDLMREGVSRMEAMRRAQMEFGGMDRAKEECRTARGVGFAESALQDLRFGLRTLRKNPGFTAVAVLTLALGIGANAAIFTVINAVLLRPLAVQHPEQLVAVGDPTRVHAWSDGTPGTSSFSYPLYREARDQNQVFSSLLASSRLDNARIVIDKGAEDVHGRVVSENYFETLGVEALVGRTFVSGDGGAPGSDPVAVISYGYWQKRFAGSAGVVGQTVELNGIPMTIIGVAGPKFQGEVVEDQPDVWAPMMMEPQLMPEKPYLETANISSLLLVGRLKPGVTMGQAKANLDGLVRRALTGRLEAMLSADDRNAVRNKKIDVQVSDGGRGLSHVRAEFGQPLWLLMGMVGLVLVVACINVANLMLARSAARQKEMAVRLAIGAGAGRVIRQLLTESLLLATLGGALGLLLAKSGAAALVRMAEAGVGVRNRLDLDWRVLGFTAAVCFLAALLFGLGPALRFVKVGVGTVLGSGARHSGPRMKLQTGRLLLGAQIAMGVFVLMGAGLLVRSLWKLEGADLGYSRDKLLLVRVDLGASGYRGESLHHATEELLYRFAALSGVKGATASTNGLYSGSESEDRILLDGAPPTNGEKDSADDEIGPNYFSTIGVPMVMGREITQQDFSRRARVAVVNETFAKQYFGDRNPLGHTVGIQDSEHPNTPPYEIIGVAKDVRDHDVRTRAKKRLYAPLSAGGFDETGAINFEIRAKNPGALLDTVRKTVLNLNAGMMMDDPETADALVGETLGSQVMAARLSALFGGLVLLLVSVGLYGTMAYNVATRTNEIGLRMALGIPRSSVLWMVAREAGLVLALGALLGVPMGMAGSRVFQSMLFEVGGSDPASIAGAILLLVGVCLAAAIGPARRAMQVDPMVALRCE